MDQEEILCQAESLIRETGTVGEDIFTLGVMYERIEMFNKFRALLHQKDLMHDEIAVDVLNWAYQLLAE
jgi:hypothetical protein